LQDTIAQNQLNELGKQLIEQRMSGSLSITPINLKKQNLEWEILKFFNKKFNQLNLENS